MWEVQLCQATGLYRPITTSNEPADLWTSRIESKYRDRCPRIMPYQDGQIWVCDDTLGQSLSQGTNAGRRFDDPETIKNIDVFENVLPGSYIPRGIHQGHGH